MAEVTRISGCSEWVELDIMDRDWSPSQLMELGVRSPLPGLSFSNIVPEFEKFSIDVQQFDLYAAVDPETNIFLYLRSFTIPLTQQFLREFRKKTDVEDMYFLSIRLIIQRMLCNEQDFDFRSYNMEIETLSNVSLERENEELARLATVSATSIQRLPKQDYRPSPFGETRLTKHGALAELNLFAHTTHGVVHGLPGSRDERGVSRSTRNGS